MNLTVLSRHFEVSRKAIDNAVIAGLFVKIKHKPVYSEEHRKRLSEKRKEWLKNNPEKHPWRSKDKFKSVPCERLKAKLKSEGINFLAEYIPLPDRSFSLDVAFPDKKIGLEVNGQQHYNSDGTLKPYYQERHDLLASQGWNIVELHYSTIFNSLLVNALVCSLKSDKGLGTFDYSSFFKEQCELKEKKKLGLVEHCKKCGTKIGRGTKTGQCPACCSLTKRKVERPSREELERDLKSMSFCAAGRKYGVTDNAIRKWLRVIPSETASGSGV
jgi:hypothetical protein